LIVINVSQSAAGREQPASVRETGALALMAFVFIAAAGLFFFFDSAAHINPR